MRFSSYQLILKIKNNFAVDSNSFSYKIPSSEYIQTVTDYRFIFFSRRIKRTLTIIGWDNIMYQIPVKSLIKKANRISRMSGEDAKAWYLNFLDKFLQLSNRIPLSLLA